MTTLEKKMDKIPARLFTKVVDGKVVRMGIFTGRFYKEEEEFESPADCPRCKTPEGEPTPMPKLATYTGPFCAYRYGGCGYFPEGTRHIFDKPKEETRDAK